MENICSGIVRGRVYWIHSKKHKYNINTQEIGVSNLKQFKAVGTG